MSGGFEIESEESFYNVTKSKISSDDEFPDVNIDQDDFNEKLEELKKQLVSNMKLDTEIQKVSLECEKINDTLKELEEELESAYERKAKLLIKRHPIIWAIKAFDKCKNISYFKHYFPSKEDGLKYMESFPCVEKGFKYSLEPIESDEYSVGRL